jgi:hypothetical protein
VIALTPANLLAYSAQIAVVALVGGGLLIALRVQTPQIQYASWRTLLALCLALPWLQTPRIATTVAAPVTPALTTSLDLSAVATAPPAATGPPWTDWIGPVLIAGVVLRLLWIGIGCLRLARLRRRGEPASDRSFDEVAHAIGARAEIRYVRRL